MKRTIDIIPSFTFRIIAAILLVILMFVLFILNLKSGVVNLGISELFGILTNESISDSALSIVVLKIRFPQAITALMAGWGLAAGGLLMQTLFRNPLADPSILGISSGASLGVAILILISGSLFPGFLSGDISANVAITIAAFIGAAMVLVLISLFATKLRNPVNLLVFGIMIGFLSYAVVDILKFYASKDALQKYVLWGMATFAEVDNRQLQVFLISGFIGIVFALLLVKPLNALLLGEDYAANLGHKVKHIRIIIILVAGFLTAVITAFCGPVAFVGLAVPHLARLLFATSDHRQILPFSILIGGNLTLFVNLIIRLPVFGGNLPVNAITALLGAPVVIYFILKTKF
ncbi:MAG: iron ABC transporter permease [Bacteroidales bacterium]|jgi:iron complex transport system permease protein|nr:iron ABC transporter permease [Bacteroidales bacterium]